MNLVAKVGLTGAGAILALGVLADRNAGPTTAEQRPAVDRAYLADLHRHGIAENDDTMIEYGHVLCEAWAVGTTPAETYDTAIGAGAPPADYLAIMSAATVNYCPEG